MLEAVTSPMGWQPWWGVVVAPLLALALALAAGNRVIERLRNLGVGQHVRGDIPEAHREKEGTPTMGGLLIVAALAVGVIVGTVVAGAYTALLLLAFFLLFAALGGWDDWRMIYRGRAMGLPARQKLGAQILLAIGFALVLRAMHHPTDSFAAPFTKLSWAVGWWYYPLAVLFIAATSNAVNLTDGLDGLAGGLGAIAAASLGIAATWMGQTGVALFCFALGGACIGFLYFNLHPARVFMGDTGSLAIGAGLAAAAVMMRAEILLIVFGLLFYLEELSVILQVISFQLTRRRIFRMSPLHHHFELGGVRETRIVAWFWAVGALISAAVVYGAWHLAAA
jgi:phospho-N-acetylmuramoyl-pentapeptide-transferase